jgi:hypothetical protein
MIEDAWLSDSGPSEALLVVLLKILVSGSEILQ